MKPGDLFGAYRILRRLDGRSGYEEFLGLDRARFLYVRLRIPLTPGDEEALALLRAQADLRQRLSHDGLSGLVELGDAEGTLFLALDYVGGKSLEGLAPFEEGELLSLVLRMVDLAEALVGEGVMPWRLAARDWALARDGQLRLLEACSPDPNTNLRGTQRWLVLAPEAFLRGGGWDESCIVHALVSLMVELISGKPLTPGKSVQEILEGHEALRRGGADELLSTLPPGWSELVRAMFSSDGPRRLAELRTLLEALSQSSFHGKEDDRLSMLERADTRYWKAMSLTGEGRGEEALVELLSLLSLSSEVVGAMGTSISALAETVYWNAASEHEQRTGLAAEAFVDLLRAVLLVHRKCGALHRARVVERHLLETILMDFGHDREGQDHRFRQALSLCADPLVTKQEYVRFLEYRGDRERARNVQIQLAGRYRQRGHVDAALRELDKVREGEGPFRYAALHGQIKRQAMRLDMEREDLTRCLGTLVRRERRLEKARAFLERHPGDVKGMELVLGEGRSLGLDEHEIEEIRWRLAVREYECFALEAAFEHFRTILQANPRREDALSYVADCLRRRGLRLQGSDRAEWVKLLSGEVEKGAVS